MTKAEAAFLEKLRRRAAALSPDVRRRVLAAYDIIRESLSAAELGRVIRSGQIDRIIFDLLDDAFLDPRLRPLEIQIDRTVMRAVELEASGLPARAGVGFNVLNPRVIAAAESLHTRALGALKAEIRETVLEHVTAGLEAGKAPRTIARAARDVIGLAPSQAESVRNFERMLRERDRTALRRKLRDRRFDPTLRRALGRHGEGLSAEQIERMTAAYRRRFIAFNAETNARTLTLEALKIGQRLTWEDAIARGVVSADELGREWLAVGGPVGDGRNREEHLAMHGERRAFHEPYSNGEIVPGESTYNCRCRERVFFLALERAA